MRKQAGQSPVTPIATLPCIKRQMAVRRGPRKSNEDAMKTKLLPLLLLFTTACTFQVQVLTTPTPQPTAMEIIPPQATPTALFNVAPSATPLPLPTVSAPGAATNTPLPVQVANPGTSASPIQFGPNG